MSDVAEEAFKTLMEVDELAKAKISMKAGVKIDQFQAELWKRLAKHGLAKEIKETLMGDAIGTGKVTLGFKTDAGTEIWLQQPVGENTVIPKGISVHGNRNVDLMFVRYKKSAAGDITDIYLTGLDNHSQGPDSKKHLGHFEDKQEVMEAWEVRFKEKYPDAKLHVRFDKEDSFFYAEKIEQLKKLETEAKAVASDAAKVKQAESQVEKTAEEIEAKSLSVAEKHAGDAFNPLAKDLLKAAGTSATLAGIAWKGKEVMDVELKLYMSPSLHSLMLAIKSGDQNKITHWRNLIVEWTRPDTQVLFQEFLKLGLSPTIGAELWEKFVDFLIKQWTNAAAAAKKALAAEAAKAAGE